MNLFLTDQQNLLKTQELTLSFHSTPHAAWSIWPQVTITYPTIQKDVPSSLPQTIWQAKQANISYSLLHPLSIAIQLDGEQLFCLKGNTENCFQTHGSAWKILVPFWNDHKGQSIYFNCAEIFYTNTSQSKLDIKSLQFKNIQGDLNWNNFAGQKDSLAFSHLNIEQTLVMVAALPLQKLEHIEIQSALIKENNAPNLSDNLYKLLIQKADFSWNSLSVNSTGKLYMPFPRIVPTGELLLHLNGIDQTINQQLALYNCCSKLKELLSQTSLPSQMNFTLFIREGIVYLGAIPLQPIWYDHLKTLIDVYAK